MTFQTGIIVNIIFDFYINISTDAKMCFTYIWKKKIQLAANIIRQQTLFEFLSCEGIINKTTGKHEIFSALQIREQTLEKVLSKITNSIN